MFGAEPDMVSKQPRGASPTRSRATSTLGAVKDWEAGELLRPERKPMTPPQVRPRRNWNPAHAQQMHVLDVDLNRFRNTLAAANPLNVD